MSDESNITDLLSTSINAMEGRENYWNGQYELAAKAFIQIFEANPEAWWFALEALRSLRSASESKNSPRTYSRIMFSPDYAGNSYQSNLYSEQQKFRYTAIAINRMVFSEDIVSLSLAKGAIFHQHWLKELYWNAKDIPAGIAEIDRHIGILRALRCFKVRIVWTLHNLIDHDASPMQLELCQYAIKKMVEISEVIFIHTIGAGIQLSELYGKDLTEKFQRLPHPLYDDLLESVSRCLPKEINPDGFKDCRVLVSAGMIRPYKGIPDLIEAFSRLIDGNCSSKLHLIIAGHCSDPQVLQSLNLLSKNSRSSITFLPRKLTEAEMAGLMDIADVCVTPYRKVLTSGSFYLTTTFGKPTVAPNIGMFCESIRNKVTGFLYDGSLDDLTSTLRYVAQLSDSDLASIGKQAFEENRNWTVAAASTKLFEILEQPR